MKIISKLKMFLQITEFMQGYDTRQKWGEWKKTRKLKR